MKFRSSAQQNRTDVEPGREADTLHPTNADPDQQTNPREPMNQVDALVVLLLLVGVVAGARAGFLGPVAGLAGAVIGFAVALALANLLREPMEHIEQPARAIATIVFLGAFVLLGEALGSTVGAHVSHGMRNVGLRPLDAVGGAIVGVLHIVLLVWLIGGMIAAGMAPGLGSVARDSVALRTIEDRLPPASIIAGRLLTMLDTTGLPPLFEGLGLTPAPPLELPADSEVRALAESAIRSSAKVSSTGCGVVAVGSGFFVSPEHVVTNAHVVAGGDDVAVTLGDVSFTATVVAFDPDADLALLHTVGTNAPALELMTGRPGRGSTGVVLGFPGGGELTVEPATVTASFEIGGPDIYGDGFAHHSVVEMRSNIQRGNSGGPLVVEPGVVGGVVFGGSRSAPDVGYAIGPDQALARIGAFIGSTAAVDTGACL
jgi:uncharacterized membrane protein required for colicin V production